MSSNEPAPRRKRPGKILVTPAFIRAGVYGILCTIGVVV